MKFKLVIFDWNGTLLDDVKTSYHSVIEIFARFKLPAPPLETMRSTADFMAFYHDHGIPQRINWGDLNGIREEVFFKRWHELRLHQGAFDALQHCRATKLATSIISAEIPRLLEKAVWEFKLVRLLDHFCGGAWPKELEFAKAMERFGAKPEETLLIDDNTHGLEAGKKIGFTTVGATYGYMPKEHLAKARPDFFIDSLAELLPLIA